MTRGRDPFVALLLEIVGGFFGFLGLGWIYAGRPALGILLLVGCWLLDSLGVGASIITQGAWCCILPAQNLIFGAVSGYLAYRHLNERL